MPGTPPPDPRGNVDHGTQLGTGTRLLTSAFRLPVRVARAVGRGVSHLGSVSRRGWLIAAAVVIVLGLAAVAAFDSPATAGTVALTPVVIAGAIAVSLVLPVLLIGGVIKAAPYVGRAIACAARFVWHAIGPRLRAVGRAVAAAVVFVARPIGVALVFLAVVAWRAAAYVAVRIARAVMFTARPIGNVIAVAVRAIGHVVAVAAVGFARAVAYVAIHTAHGVAIVAVQMARAVVLVAHPIGHALRAAARALGHLIAVAAVGAAHAVASVAIRVARASAFVAAHVASGFLVIVRPIGRGLVTAARAFDGAVGVAARAVGRALMFVFAPIGHGIARASSAVHRTVLAPVGHGIASMCRACGHAFMRVVARVNALALVAASWVRTRVLRIRHSVGVAAVRARQTSVAAAAAPTHAAATRVAASPPPFSAEVFHNEYLPAGSRTVDAVITVTAHADPDTDGPTPTAEVILVDCSGSMGQPWRKIRAARAATIVAIDALPDGGLFAVVRANHDADVVYPNHAGLAVKTDRTAAEARRSVQMLWPEGGTAMGRWLLVARELLAGAPHAIGHAILLTDGKNESERPEELATARRACRGRFQCDCRGVGTDWDVAELRGIAQELLGSVDIVADPADLAADFQAMAERAAAKRVDGVTLRVWTPVESTVGFIKQVSPSIEDLGLHPIRIDARTVDYPTGAWSDESRDYHLSIQLPDRPAGTELLAARVSLVVGDRVVSKALVTATWTDDLELSTRIVPEVVHYTGQSELLGAVQDGLERRRAGDEEGALSRLGEAARRAYETGNEATLQLLAKVVEIDDAPTGRVRARAVVDDADVMALDTRSTRTKRFAPAPEPVPSVSSD